jgi:DNA-binding NtrC family response regulator
LWNRKQAAKLLNIDYKALLYKMRKLGIGERSTENSAAGNDIEE